MNHDSSCAASAGGSTFIAGSPVVCWRVSRVLKCEDVPSRPSATEAKAQPQSQIKSPRHKHWLHRHGCKFWFETARMGQAWPPTCSSTLRSPQLWWWWCLAPVPTRGVGTPTPGCSPPPSRGAPPPPSPPSLPVEVPNCIQRFANQAGSHTRRTRPTTRTTLAPE